MKKVIAIDCGGTNLRVAVVDEELNILAVRRVPTIHDDPSFLYETMKRLIGEVLEEHPIEITSIGISMCGTVVRNYVQKAGNLGIENGFDLEALFNRDFPGAIITIANDGNCSALVEAEYGANKGLKDSGFITLSTGIGLGVIYNGEMLDLPLEGGRTMCEYKGSLYENEYLLSGNGIVNLCKMNDYPVEDAKAFFDGVLARDPKMLQIYDLWIGRLGIWLGNIHLLFNLEGYALSGGVMKSSKVFLKDLERIANASIASWHFRPIVLKEAKFSQDVGLAAAGTLALHALNK